MQTPALSTQQVQSFETDGFLHARNVLSSKELDILRAAEERITAPATAEFLDAPDYAYTQDPRTKSLYLNRVNNIVDKGGAFLHLYGHPQLLRIAECIQGRNLLPLNMSLVVKTPGFGAAVPWHRDPAHCRVRHGINLGVYLDDSDEDNGMVYVLPGTHLKNDIHLQALIDEHGFRLPGAIPVPARAGDVVIHCENTLHGSRSVNSNRKRRVIYFGIRTVDEHLARGQNASWIRNIAAIFLHAARERAESEIGKGETPFQWNPTSAEYQPAERLNAHVELRQSYWR